jgi:DNA mismatch repair protein MutS
VPGIVEEYLALKRDADADLLAMQVGDFYEFFAADAETVADELDLKVSEKSSHGSSYPMAGVPVDELTPYVKSLVERGYRVAVADQRETDGGHEREVTRVVTPGTLLETTDADARYVAAIVDDEDDFGLAFVDATTGRFQVTSVASRDAALSECYRFDPVEVLPGPDLRTDDATLDALRERTDAALALHEAAAFDPGRAAHAVRDQFGDEALGSVGLDRDDPAVRAAGAVLSYVRETGVGVDKSLSRLNVYRPDGHVALDATTRRNLELAETMQGGRDGSLLATVDHTVTSAGGRLLGEWLTRPRRSVDDLRRRQDCVAALAEAAMAREALRDRLDGAYDLERLASKAAHGSADARDLLRVRDTLAVLPALADLVAETPALAGSPLADVVERPDRERAADLHDELADALVDDPPGTVTQGGLFRRGYHDDLDDLIDRYEDAMDWLDGLAEREKRRHGITHLQVDRNRTDGYYVQVGRSEVEKVPDEYREVKTLKNSKRYTTDALDEREREILRIEAERGDLERRLFEELRERVADAAPLLQDVGRALAELDALASFAVHAVNNDWTRPEVTTGDHLDVKAGRHPVVEQTTEFVPNDAHLDDGRRFVVVTGPNMSGKSTYMRQVALVVLLAQIGSFVPARSATVGVVDGIYTRVGALDELAQGRSTFMVEMQELSNILHSATDDSLVILDEVGRGTATYDGISIAWAATEYLHNEVRAKTLFATHYHELTELADRLDGVENVHVAADERDGDVTFLRTVKGGPANRSYGVHVADLAGVPDPVVDRARDVLRKLREEKRVDVRGGGGSRGTQQVVFDLGSGSLESGERVESDGDGGLDPATESVVEELREVDVAETPPLDLMAAVQEWKRRLDEGE